MVIRKYLYKFFYYLVLVLVAQRDYAGFTIRSTLSKGCDLQQFSVFYFPMLGQPHTDQIEMVYPLLVD